jgi:hypothetical protein
MIMNATNTNKYAILKTLDEKLSIYTFEFVNLVMLSKFILLVENPTSNPSTYDFQKIEELLVDFWVFFKENSASLPDDVSEQVRSIYMWMKFLHETASENMPKLKYNEINIYLQSLKHELFHYHRTINQYSREEWEELDYLKIFNLFMDDIQRLKDDMKELSESGTI